MHTDLYQQLKNEAQQIEPVSQEALQAFQQSFPLPPALERALLDVVEAGS